MCRNLQVGGGPGIDGFDGTLHLQLVDGEEGQTDNVHLVQPGQQGCREVVATLLVVEVSGGRGHAFG